jgi:hypothetical protein
VQCVVLSIGRYDDSYIITEEPEPSDRLIQNLRSAVTTGKRSHVSGIQSADPGLHMNLPFELRALETVLDESAKLLGVEVRGVVRSAEKRMKRLSDKAVRHTCVRSHHQAHCDIEEWLMGFRQARMRAVSLSLHMLVC